MKAVAYLRYSSTAQREVSLDDQLKEIKKYASQEEIELIDVYSDAHLSGTNDKRPAFQQMIADSKDGNFDLVIVYKLDRFARSRTDSAIYKKVLRDNGVRVVSAMERIPESTEGILMEGVIESFGEYYSKQLGELTLRGMSSNAEKCLTNGVRIYGYQTAPDGTYEINPSEAPIVKELFRMAARGEELGVMLSYLKSHGVKTQQGNDAGYSFLHTMLKNEKYKGTYFWGNVRVEHGMPAIVDEQLFDSIQKIKRPTSKAKADYYLVGKAYCVCGRSLRGKSAKSGKYFYYDCPCGNSIRKERLEELCKESVKEALTEEVSNEIIDKLMRYAKSDKRESEVTLLKSEIKSVKKKLDGVLDLILEQKSEYLQEKYAELEERYNELKEELESKSECGLTEDQIRKAFNYFKDKGTTKEVLRIFIYRVYISKTHVFVTFCFGKPPEEKEIVRTLEEYAQSDFGSPDLKVCEPLGLATIVMNRN